MWVKVKFYLEVEFGSRVFGHAGGSGLHPNMGINTLIKLKSHKLTK